MFVFEYGIVSPGDEALVGDEWKKISTYNYEEVYFVDGTSEFTENIKNVRLNNVKVD